VLPVQSGYVLVGIQVPMRRLFVYRMPSEPLVIGQRLRVSFNGKITIGIAVGTTDHAPVPENRIKPVIAVLPNDPVAPELVHLLSWASRYYQYPIGEALALALPPVLRKTGSHDRTSGAPKTQDRATRYWRLTEAAPDPASLPGRATRMREVLAMLTDNHEGLCETIFKTPARVFKALADKGWIEAAPAARPGSVMHAHPEHPLEPQQRTVVTALASNGNGFKCWLLEGVTGSGKTEVYLRVVSDYLAKKRQVLVLVPEIGLTPQILTRFEQRFPCCIAVIHSAVQPARRLHEWQRCAAGEAQILLGTRSALFTPLPNLGIIIVDEEHDPSFKQQSGLRYCARDLAVKYARNRNIPILLGSATPSLETLANVLHGNYGHLRLPQRVRQARMPRWKIVDMRRERISNGLCEQTMTAIKAALDKDEQVLVFINRRGFAPVLMCSQCGWCAACDECDARLTVHRHQWSRDERMVLVCHHCHARRPVPENCPECSAATLLTLGIGTQRGEALLKAAFPDEKLLRIDGDRITSRKTLLHLLDSLAQGKRRILVGTQMLAKSHDMDNLNLVVIPNADAGLFSADFRAPERLAQLLVQVAGRGGRTMGSQGMVMIQTRCPEHPLLQTIMHRGYHEFAVAALRERRATRLPPYTRMALVHAQSVDPKACERVLADLTRIERPAEVQCWGPLSAPIMRKANEYRMQLVLNARNPRILQQTLKTMVTRLECSKSSGKTTWSIDVDPIDLS